MEKTFVDFFAGIGLVEMGLSNSGWKHLQSVDYSPVKYKAYKSNYGDDHANLYRLIDVLNLDGAEVPTSFLAHASFPCTDVSSAGAREGVQDGKESSAIDSFLRIIDEMEERKPAVLMLENVKGLITSHEGRDLRFLVKHINNLGYFVDLLCIDAKHFVPQSRERVFLICQHSSFIGINKATVEEIEELKTSDTRGKPVINFIKKNDDLDWYIRALPNLPTRKDELRSIVDENNDEWWEEKRTEYLLSQMFPRHLDWLNERKNQEIFSYATAFRRMRVRDGARQSTAEIRTDGIAGCLRTAKGGSAKQIIVRTGKGQIDARLLSPQECSRLMGANNFNFGSDVSINDALYCLGDAVCVNVVEWLDSNYLSPLFEELRGTTKHEKLNTEDVKTMIPQDVLILEDEFWRSWCKEHKQPGLDLPIKGRLFGALIVLDSVIGGHWTYDILSLTKTTDKGHLFADRSIRGHTSHRIKKIVSNKKLPHLAEGHGEQGRTSTGTKRAGLDIILGLVQLADRTTGNTDKDTIVKYHAESLIEKCLQCLEEHYNLGGIEIYPHENETISTFINRLVHYPSKNSGAICQHLVGAKLELRYSDNKEVCINHNGSNTADVQTGREGDFQIHDTVFHVTKTPSKEHRAKALMGSKKGYKVVLLVPKSLVAAQSASAETEGLCKDFEKSVEVFALEQFIAQNIDELALFDKNLANLKLDELITKYNELVDRFENDKSIIIQTLTSD